MAEALLTLYQPLKRIGSPKLAEPYSMKQIDELHRRYPSQTLHPDFVTYLTQVSSETICSSYRTIVKLDLDEYCTEEFSELNIAMQATSQEEHCAMLKRYEKLQDNDEFVLDDSVYLNCIQIGESGCNFQDYLVTDVSSAFYGKVVLSFSSSGSVSPLPHKPLGITEWLIHNIRTNLLYRNNRFYC